MLLNMALVHSFLWLSSIPWGVCPSGQGLKHLPVMMETWVWSLDPEGPLEKEMATTPVFLPGESIGWRSLVGYSPRGHKESDTTEQYTEELYKKDFHDPNNHDGVITHLEPDVMEWGVKWALGSITMNKASGGDGIPAELFQILKDDAVKVLHSICKFGKLSSGHRTGKGQFSFQSQRKAMPKNAQTTTQLHSSHTLVK